LEYKRPCGWKRYALKVRDKYEDIEWLGQNGESKNDSEWAVSYHGTKIYCAEPIVKEGLKPGHNNVYGIGIYCTPNIKTAEKYAEILEDIDTFVQNANNENEDSFKTMLKNLNDYYEAYLMQFNSTLNTFDDIIAELMSEINQYIGDDGNFFSFLNGKFIKANIKIILKYLKDALGSNIYSIGVSLTIVGCSLMLSISSTLILLAIINDELKQHIKNENTPVQAMASSSEMKFNGVSPFQPKPILPA